MILDEKLIFDVGAHKGEDTSFYLSKGFRVVAIDANPTLCEVIAGRFPENISNGSLIVLNKAISSETASVNFYINQEESIWGTTNYDWVERNRRLSTGAVTTIKVEALPLSEVVRQYGVPKYCKIDIEGNDVQAARSLSESCSPEFISIESEKSNWDRLMAEFEMFETLGYRKYKIIDQSLVSLQRCPLPAREGNEVDFKFEHGSSGLFGNELPGRWLDVFEAIEAYKSIFRGYATNGDAGLFAGDKKSLFRQMANLQKRAFHLRGFKSYINPIDGFPPAGWYDTHATK
jgi:FkbM family methyltransferase